MIRRFRVFLVAMLPLAIAACGQEVPAPDANANPFVMRCSEQPIPEFTLGPQSNPTAQQQAELCSCIWSRMGKWERETSENIVGGKQSEVSALNMRAFPARFGKRIEECGGMKL